MSTIDYQKYYKLIKDYLISYIYESDEISDEDIFGLIAELDEGNKLNELNEEVLHVASDLIQHKAYEFLENIRFILIPHVIKERNNYLYYDMINNDHINFIGERYRNKYIKKYSEIYNFVSNYMVYNRKLLKMSNSNVNFAIWIITVNYIEEHNELNKLELINYLDNFVDDADSFIDSYKLNGISGLFDKDDKTFNQRKEIFARYVKHYYQSDKGRQKRIE